MAPAGIGVIDAQGIRLYGELDEAPMQSDLSNLGLKSVSTQLALIRAQIQTLQQLDGWETETGVGVWTGAGMTPWGTRLQMRYRKRGNRVYVEGFGIIPAAGTLIFTLPEGYRPKDQMRTIDLSVPSRTITISSAGVVGFDTAATVGSSVALKFDFPVTW